ncbi:MAG: hypothetical protein LBF61_02765 [Azoarcus sp.]|jgi:hypothetical protein|nr:hypothetical protein [Azoarcus sp.]
MAARRYDLWDDRYAIRRGMPWSLSVRCRQPDADRTPVDLTGAAIRFEVHDVRVESARSFPASTVPETGWAEIVIGAADTATLPGEARYRIVFTDSLGVESVLLYGRLAVLEATL